MAQEEQVLVIKREVFDSVGAFNGLMFDVERYLKEIFATGVAMFKPRSEAEKDPGYKQLIPTVLISYDGRFLSDVRCKKAGETRLFGARSIGLGGQINPGDDMPVF